MAPTIVKSKSPEKETGEALLSRPSGESKAEEAGSGVGVGVGRFSGVLLAGDAFIALFVVAPLVIAFWRGAWQLVAFWPRYFPDQVLVIGGAITHFVFAVGRDIICEDWDHRNYAYPKRFFFKVSRQSPCACA